MSTNPFDKVYGMYVPLASSFDNLPRIDYSRGKNELYEEFTRATIISTQKFWPAAIIPWRVATVSNLP
jgi:hypothetical protein